MHIPTHILSGWCVANCFRLTARERFLCMAAASVPDLDGLGMVFGMESDAYQLYHHVLCHNLLFVGVVAILCAAFSKHRLTMLLVSLFLGHLHLLMDYFGSGPGWTIPYFWPVWGEGFKTDFAWELTSWQNRAAFAMLFVWTLLIGRWKCRTPVELITPELDRRFVARLRGERRQPQEVV